MTGREAALRIASVFGAIVAYGYLIACLALVGFQGYRWFQNGEWTHVGVNDGMRAALARFAGADGLSGWRAALAQWLDAPVTWLGLHTVLELVPASLALFLISILGNSLFVYTTDRLREADAARR
jgi:hypothetical protein